MLDGTAVSCLKSSGRADKKTEFSSKSISESPLVFSSLALNGYFNASVLHGVEGGGQERGGKLGWRALLRETSRLEMAPNPEIVELFICFFLYS